MDDGRGSHRGVPRRGMLKALALASAAAAGCAGPQAERAERREDGPGSPTDGAAGVAPAAAIRAFPLPADAEPAFVFRAAAARPGDGR